MISVKGKFKNGVALPLEPVRENQEGKTVIITFLDEAKDEISAKEKTARKLWKI